MQRLITEALRNQFDSTFHMAHVLVNICPEDVWASSYHEVPFWQKVFHYVFFIDFWMRERYDESEWRSMIFEEAYTPDLYGKSFEGLFISKEKMQEYLEEIQKKTTRIFDSLEDEKLGTSVYNNHPLYTYADVIVGQIRHIMYNIGYLNDILRGLGLPESDWYAYNEKAGS